MKHLLKVICIRIILSSVAVEFVGFRLTVIFKLFSNFTNIPVSIIISFFLKPNTSNNYRLFEGRLISAVFIFLYLSLVDKTFFTHLICKSKYQLRLKQLENKSACCI